MAGVREIPRWSRNFGNENGHDSQPGGETTTKNDYGLAFGIS